MILFKTKIITLYRVVAVALCCRGKVSGSSPTTGTRMRIQDMVAFETEIVTIGFLCGKLQQPMESVK